uniref:TGFb_propeptide domain-containing protein n=1 Tax=Meloidogyne hapla TaxID=6305 RepID=A0A1I8B265_MELHA
MREDILLYIFFGLHNQYLIQCFFYFNSSPTRIRFLFSLLRLQSLLTSSTNEHEHAFACVLPALGSSDLFCCRTLRERSCEDSRDYHNRSHYAPQRERHEEEHSLSLTEAREQIICYLMKKSRTIQRHIPVRCVEHTYYAEHEGNEGSDEDGNLINKK